MPAASQQQQKLMGIVHAIQKGDIKPGSVSKTAQKIAKDMPKSDVTKFASTKHKGLPKKVKKENMDGAIETVYVVKKPYSGCGVKDLVHPVNPLVGMGADQQMTPDAIHAAYADQDQANQVANELYEAYCAQETMLEEKKGQVGDKIKKAIDKLEKKYKEHLNLAKEDPKNASQHKEHIAKIATQIDDLMTKLEKIEKSKKETEKQDVEKKEDKKEDKK